MNHTTFTNSFYRLLYEQMRTAPLRTDDDHRNLKALGVKIKAVEAKLRAANVPENQWLL